jgi:lactase-phlorizin hydrolase
LGLFAHPIFSYEGDYPEVVKTRVEKKSKEEGFRDSRLPPFSLKEIDYIKGKLICLSVGGKCMLTRCV